MKHPGECRSCKAPILWAVTTRGSRMPIDAEPTSDGNWVLEGPEENPVARRLPNDAAATYTGEKYKSHFETCPQAKTWSKKGKR